MRRIVVTTLIVLAIALALPAAALGARPTYRIDTIHVTGAGGTWPMCAQTVEVQFSAGHRATSVVVYAYKVGSHPYYEFVRFSVPNDGSGVATVSTVQDYSSFAEWGWTAYLTDRHGRDLSFDYGVQTSSHTFTPGTCPASGLLATYP